MPANSMVLALDGQNNGSNAPSFMSPVVNEKG